jgi:tetratricopeptide (TPR) repeat protein
VGWKRGSLVFFAAVVAFSSAVAAPLFLQDDELRRAARLDAGGRCEDAERAYEALLARGSPSAALLNNLGNHYLICRQLEKAELYFARLLEANPAHTNANLQLARIATDRNRGAKALEYLSRVEESSPAVRLLRVEALHSAGRRAEALRGLDALERQAGADARLLFALGAAAARMSLYERAEAAFNRALAARPNDFDVLLHLGRAAARARHYGRAQHALEMALKLRPADPDALLELGLAYAALGDYSRSVYVLAQARQRAPQRPDILLPLARAAEDAGYYGDSALAYDEYLKLRPQDDAARRDRGRVCGLTGARLKEGLKELAWYIRKHPADPVGHYSLAQLTWEGSPETALEQLGAALRADGAFVPGYFARAWLLHRLGRGAESLADLEAAARLSPGNARILDQLGLAYLNADQPAEAQKVLRRALALAPRDADVAMHLGRALIALDRGEEAQSYFEQFKKLRPRRTRYPRKEPGMFELATMPADERRRREIERLRRDARSHPGDAELQLHLAGLLLADGQTAEAAAAYRDLMTRNADRGIWLRAGAALVQAGDYHLAQEFFERAGARLDLAICLFFTAGPRQALETLDKATEEERTGDYFLMRARILDAAGEPDAADEALQEGLRRASLRPDVAEQAAFLLLRRNRAAEALAVIERSSQANPGSPGLLLSAAALLALTARTAEAERALRQIESRWPEWDRAYVAHGLLLEGMKRSAEARQKLQTAVALGAEVSATQCALARLDGQTGKKLECACATGLRDYVFPACP